VKNLLLKKTVEELNLENNLLKKKIENFENISLTTDKNCNRYNIKKKRIRKLKDEVIRSFLCEMGDCKKSYG
jgi:hypothetical protein